MTPNTPADVAKVEPHCSGHRHFEYDCIDCSDALGRMRRGASPGDGTYATAAALTPTGEGGLPQLLQWWWQRLPNLEPRAAAMVEELLRSIGQVQRPTTEQPGSSVDGLDFEPDEQHAVADMANVGYSLMRAIAEHRPGYVYNESPAEIVGDLLNELDEAQPGSSVQGDAVECVICGGDGADPEVAVELRCCGRADPNGDCCGNPEPEQIPQPCRQCGGSGKVIPVSHGDTTPPPAPAAEQGEDAEAACGFFGNVKVGNAPTLAWNDYPGLGQWWVQLRIGPDHDTVLARVYADDLDSLRARANAIATALNEWPKRSAATQPEARGVEGMVLTDEMNEAGEREIAFGNDFQDAWNAALAAALAGKDGAK